MKVLFFLILASLITITIVYSLNEIIVTETELVNIGLDINDPDGDMFSYIFSKPLTPDGKWQTNYGDAGEYNITITVSDGKDVVYDTVKLIVLKKEVSPEIVSFSPALDSIDIKESDAVEFKISVKDLNNDKLEYMWFLDDELISKNNLIEFMPDYDASGVYKLVVKISDGNSTVSKEWNIRVINTDRAPIFGNMPDRIYANEGEDITLFINISDPDNDNIAIFSENLPNGAIIKDNIFKWETDYDSIKKNSFLDIIKDKYNRLSNSFEVTFSAKSNQEITSKKLKINLMDVNRAPYISALDEIVVKEGEILSINPIISDPDGDKLVIKYTGWIDTDKKQIGFDENGIHNVTIIASDGEYIVSRLIIINVVNTNRAPIFKPITTLEIAENESLEIPLDAIDPDGDKLRFYLDNPMNIQGLFIDGNILKFMPNFDIADKGIHEINFSVIASDGEFNVSRDVSVRVHNVNRKPEIVSLTPDINSFAYFSKPVKFEVIARDLDNDKLTYKWDFGGFEQIHGRNKIKRKFNTQGKKIISLIVSDGKAETVQKWNVHVIG